MTKFKTSSRGGAKFELRSLKNKTGRVYAWSQKNLKTGKSKRIEWSEAKKIFSQEYDKKFAGRIAKRKKITKNEAYKLIQTYRRLGKDFGELY